MSSDSLRSRGPVKADSEGIERTFETKAVPHPDSLNPSNDLGKLMAANPPKNDLGGRGHGGADR